MRRIGYLQAHVSGLPGAFYEVLREGLRDLGYVVDRNLVRVRQAALDRAFMSSDHGAITAPMERLMNLANLPRNARGDRAGPRYHLKTLRVALRACRFAEHGELR